MHKQIPAWLKEGTFTRDEMIAILRTTFLTLVGRYKGKIKDWDVINEAIDDETGTLRTDTMWYKQIGRITLNSRSNLRIPPIRPRVVLQRLFSEGMNKKSDVFMPWSAA